MSKQDGYASRTPADLERKYNFGQTFAEFYGLVSDARKIAEEAKSAYDGLDQEQIFNLLTNYGKAQGIYRDDAGNVYVNASYIQSGTLADDQVPASIARKTEIPKLISQLQNDSGYVEETGVTSIVKGVVTTDYVNALGISVYAAQIKDTLVIGKQLPADLAVKGDIPGSVSQLQNDKGYLDETGVTTIVGGIVTADYVNALGISAYELQSQGDSPWQSVTIANGGISFYSGYIVDNDYGTLSISASILTFSCDDVFRFYVPGSGGYNYFELSGAGLNYYDGYGNLKSYAQFIQV